MLKLCTRDSVSQKDWDMFVLNHPHGTFWHTWAWVDYLMLYQAANADRSLVIIDHDDPHVIHAIIVLVEENKAFYPNGGEGCPAPLLPTLEGYTKDQKQLFINIHEELSQKGLWFTAWPSPYRQKNIVWPNLHFNMHKLRDHAVIDLSVGEQAAWLKVRKSYRPLINKAKRERFSLFCPGQCRQYFGNFHHAHLAERGRSRTEATWYIMEEWIQTNQASLLVVVDNNYDEVGYAYFIHCGGVAYYASAVYLEKNIAHFMIWEAIQYFKRHQFKFLDLGVVGKHEDEKQQHIAFFKSGFGHDACPEIRVSLKSIGVKT